jgi:hypothetical protein
MHQSVELNSLTALGFKLIDLVILLCASCGKSKHSKQANNQLFHTLLIYVIEQRQKYDKYTKVPNHLNKNSIFEVTFLVDSKKYANFVGCKVLLNNQQRNRQ